MTEAQRQPHLHAVILAGGSGVRFWPLSRELNPKQFLTVFGGESLIGRTIARIEPMVGADALHVLTSEQLVAELRSHLACQPEVDAACVTVLAEPLARNTAAAIALAAAYALRHDPDALIAVLPSDHLLEDGDLWRDTMTLACDVARDGYLVTIGLVPTRPETGYGYIRAGEPIHGRVIGEMQARIVERFVEKPDAATAERFLGEGGYLWNSGMLVAPAALVLSELRLAGDRALTLDSASSAHFAEAAEQIAMTDPDAWTSDEARATYAQLPSVPFDKAVLEVSDRVAVVPSHMEWSDVGSLLALGDLKEPDDRGNVLVGNVTDIGSSDVIAYSEDRLLATLGLENVVVVDTSDVTLVADRDRVQDVRLVVDALRAAGAQEVVEPRTATRPWGSWTLLMKQAGFQIKSIEVLPGRRLSLQSHEHRSEHWVVVSGTARVERDGEIFEVAENESIYLPAGCKHRLGNEGGAPLKIVEVAVGDYLSEDDIVRYEDDWRR